MAASTLIPRYLQHFQRPCETAPALDLACGMGGNGLYLLNRGIPVVFADRDSQSLEKIEQELEAGQLESHKHLARLWNVDLETTGACPLEPESFGAIMVFRYLHRPLLEGIKDALIPGGLVIYETFTVHQPHFGRPCNPDFLLQEGELGDCFCGWQILHDFEGVEHDPRSGKPRAIAQLVAVKPVA